MAQSNKGLQVLFKMATNNADNQKILDNAMKALKVQAKNFDIKIDTTQLKKQLQNANVEIDATTKKINKMFLSMQTGSGRSFNINLGVKGSNVSIDSINESADLIKPAQKYLQLTQMIASQKKEVNKIQLNGDITPKMQQQLNSYNDTLQRLINERSALKASMDESGKDYTMLYNKADILDNIEVERVKRQQEISRETKSTSKALREYENNLKAIAQQEKILYNAQERASKSSFNNTEENKKVQQIARQEIEKRTSANENLVKGLKGNKTAQAEINKLDEKYCDISNQNVSLIKAQYAENKSLFRDMMSGWKEATARIINYTVIYRSVWLLISGFKAGIQTIVELNKSFTDIQMVTGSTSEEVAGLAKEYSNLAREMGSTISDVTSGATEWLRQGKTAKETSELLRQSMILSKTGAMESAEATEYLTSTINGYKMATEDASRIVDVFSKLDMSAATSSKELAVAFSRTANSASDAGMKFEELAGYITTVSETTRRSASSVGESFKTVFSRLSNVKVGKIVDDETGESINDVESALGTLGIKLRKSATEWRDASDVLKDVGTNWKNYNDLQKNTIVTSLAGVRQAEALRAAFNNFDKVLEYTQEAYEATGSSAEKYEIYLDGIEAKQNELSSSLQSIAYQPVFEGMYKGVLNVGIALADMLNVAMSTPVTFLAIGFAIKKAFGADIAKNIKESVNNFNELGKALNAIGTKKNGLKYIFGTGDQVVNMLNKMKPATQELVLAQNALSESQITGALKSKNLTDAQLRDLLTKKLLEKQTIANTATTISFGTALKGLWATLISNPLMWIPLAITGVMGLKSIFDHFNITLEEQQEKLRDIKSEYDDIISNLDSLNDKLDETKERLRQIQADGKIEITEQEEYNRLVAQNEELEREIKLQEALRQLKEGQVAQEAIKTVNKKTEKSLVANTTGSGNEYYTSVDRTEAIEERINSYNKLKAVVDDLKNKQLELDLTTRSGEKQYNKLQSRIDSTEKTMQEYATYISDTTSTLQEEKKSLIGNSEEVVNSKTKIEEITKVVSDFVDKINGVTVATNNSTQAIKMSLSPLEQALQDYNNGKITLKDYIAILNDSKAVTGKYTNEIHNIAVAQDYLSEIIDKVNDKQDLTKDEVKNLVALYPDLQDAVTETSNGFTIQSEVLGTLNSALTDLRVANETMEIALTNATRDGTLKRLEIYKEELTALKERQKAMNSLMDKLSTGAPYNTSKEEYDIMKNGGMFSPFAMLPQAQKDTNNLIALEEAEKALEKAKEKVGKVDYSGVSKAERDKEAEKNKKDILEEYNKNKKIIDAKIQLSKTIQSLNEEGSEEWYDEIDKQTQYYKDAQSLANNEAQRLRNLGYTESSEQILQLKQDYMSATQQMEELSKAIITVYNKQKSWYDLVISNSQLAQSLYEEDTEEYKKQQKKQYDYYIQVQKLAHEQADKLRKLGYKETSQEILQLQADYMNAAKSIKAFTDSLISEFKNNYAQGLMDEVQDQIDRLERKKENDPRIKSLNKQIEAENRRLELLQEQRDEEAEKTEEIKKQKELIDSLTKQKDIRVFSAEKGWTWERDNAQIQEEQKTLTDLEYELEEIKIQKNIESLQEELDRVVESYERQAEVLEKKLKSQQDAIKELQEKEKVTLTDLMSDLSRFGGDTEEVFNSLLDYINDIRKALGEQALDLTYADYKAGQTTSGTKSSGSKSVIGTIAGAVSNAVGSLIDKAKNSTSTESNQKKYLDSLVSKGGGNGEWAKAQIKAGKYDSGGSADGKGVMVKDVIEPERVLSPEQTKSFEKLVNYLPKVTPILKSFNNMTPNQIGTGSNSTDNSVSIDNLTIQAQNGDTLQSLLLEAKNLAKMNKK